MRRHPALQDLSRDHHFALVRARELQRAAEAGEDQARAAAEDLVAFWHEELALHFREEEDVLLPALGEHVDLDGDADTERLLADHAWFATAIERLEAALADTADVRGSVASFGERLAEHARFEDRTYFPRLEEVLDAQALDRLHASSLAFRREHRGEAAIGPRDRCDVPGGS